jgi:hypothetical protein
MDRDQNQDAALLRRFEPIIRYTRGERFFPTAVDIYVQRASLWLHRPNQLPRQIIPSGELTLDNLADPRFNGADALYFLKFIEPLEWRELAAQRLREGLGMQEPEEKFRTGGGRLARVGFSSRLVDAAFSLTLLARGQVPGDTAVAAAQTVKQWLKNDIGFTYYGRVVQSQSWVVLQYWYFYPYNNWRSGFYGANDHEADWEVVNIYLYEAAGELHPEWIAYAAHDASGDDLRRRWDDQEVEKIGEHPVLYAGAGSHAGYFQPGEYLTEVQLSFLARIKRPLEKARTTFNMALWDTPPDEEWAAAGLFTVAFVDYARGDGKAIGPGQPQPWRHVHLLDESQGWLSQYRGLWGLYARDAFSGENAPAGPMYNRDGSVRRVWYDPAGWSGLDKVTPPPQRLAYIQNQLDQIAARRSELTAAVQTGMAEMDGLGIEVAAMRGYAHLQGQRRDHEKRIRELSAELDQKQRQLTQDKSLAEALRQYSRRIEKGERAPARAHIKHAHQPFSAEGMRASRFAEFWAAISIGLTLTGFVIVLLFFQRFSYVLLGLMALLLIVLVVEASSRRFLTSLVANATIVLALIAALALFVQYFWPLLVALILLAGTYITIQNLRELVQ